MYFRLFDKIFINRRLKLIKSRQMPGPIISGPESKAETMVIDALSKRSIAFSIQEQQSNANDKTFCYRTDISIRRPFAALKIDVEIDGDFKSYDDKIQDRMNNRNAWFTQNGWHVIRFYASDCYNNADQVAEEIIDFLLEKENEHTKIIDTELGGEKLDELEIQHFVKTPSSFKSKEPTSIFVDSSEEKALARERQRNGVIKLILDGKGKEITDREIISNAVACISSEEERRRLALNSENNLVRAYAYIAANEKSKIIAPPLKIKRANCSEELYRKISILFNGENDDAFVAASQIHTDLSRDIGAIHSEVLIKLSYSDRRLHSISDERDKPLDTRVIAVLAFTELVRRGEIS